MCTLGRGVLNLRSDASSKSVLAAMRAWSGEKDIGPSILQAGEGARLQREEEVPPGSEIRRSENAPRKRIFACDWMVASEICIDSQVRCLPKVSGAFSGALKILKFPSSVQARARRPPLCAPSEMGLLDVAGAPLEWSEAKKHADHVRKHGIEQFISIYNKNKDTHSSVLRWGDEVLSLPA